MKYADACNRMWCSADVDLVMPHFVQPTLRLYLISFVISRTEVNV